MNIHVFIHAFRRAGGIERYAQTMARSYRAAGHRVVFHCREADFALAEELGVELQHHPVFSFPRKLRSYYFFRRMAALAPHLDGLQISLTRLLARDAVICGGTHRGYLSRARKFPGPLDLLQIKMEARAYAFARRVISHSRLCTRELIELYGVPPEKIITLHPPVDGSFSPPADPARIEGRRRLGLPMDKVVFLFPSTGHRRKGLEPIRRALRNYSDQVVLAVAGKPPRGRPEPFLFYLGYINNMAEAYAAADFTILGSLYEPFGLVGVESILCGTRLVFEENAGCLEVIDPGAFIPFSVWNQDSIRQALQEALKLAATGRQRLPDPKSALTYDPGVAPHFARLLDALKPTT